MVPAPHPRDRVAARDGATATAHLAAFRSLAATVAAYGYVVAEVRETRVGYVVHEDDVQVVAEPFRDTRTR